MLTIGANERVTMIEAWKNPINSKWSRLRITLNSNVSKEYKASSYSDEDIPHQTNIPTGEEFTGIYIRGAVSDCIISTM